MLAYMIRTVNFRKNIFILNSVISQIQSCSDQLGHAHVYIKPTEPIDKSEDESTIFLYCVFGGGILLIGVFLFQWGFKSCGAGLLDFLICIFLIFPFSIALLIMGGFCIFICLNTNSENAKTYRKEMIAYDTAYAEYEKNIYVDEARVRKELVRKEFFSKKLQELQGKNNNNKQQLYFS